MSESKRTARIGEAIREEISSILLQEINDPRIQFVSITRVEVSADLQHAKVYVSILGTDQKKEEAFEGLKSARGYIQKKLGKKIRLRYMPEITFKMDTSIDHGMHIFELLQEMKKKGELKDEE
ncbi:MAG: 30S ribosome-binding factor RbfA [bacterium]